MKHAYGLDFADVWTPLDIEMHCIRKGGQWVESGVTFGAGLFHHYRAMQSAIWPTDDHHRWSDLILKNVLEQRITVIQGARDSSKTHTLSKYALCDYWCFPEETLILVSSTGLRELQLRVWGDIKDLFSRAREVYPELPGNMVEGKYGIFSDQLEENSDVRDQRKGLICVPCIGGDGEWIGMSRFQGIKQKRRRLIGDECFPAGTMVDTPSGKRRIESIKQGDTVWSAAGPSKVVRVGSRWADVLVTVSTLDGRRITCTPEHPFFTNGGWKKACEINEQHYILATYETMRILRKGVYSKGSEGAFLQRVLRLETRSQPSRDKGILLGRAQEIAREESWACSEAGKADARSQSDAQPGELCESSCEYSSQRGPTESEGWKRNRADEGGMATNENVSRGGVELRSENRKVERQRISPSVQNGHCIPSLETGYRGGWSESQQSQEKVFGREERLLFEGAWVDRVEVHKQGDIGFQNVGANPGRGRVYNIEVEGHPSYSVEGLVVHNCQYMQPVYVTVLDALDKGDFRGVFCGNPIGGNGMALDKLAEPKAGWSSLGEVTKTRVWENKFGGVTINLVGTDSPNFDANRPKNYPYLIDQGDVDRVSARNGKDSAQFWSFIMGVRKTGVDMYRVLTTEMCERCGAFDAAVWAGDTITKVYAIDAGYGGDPCESILIEFGKDAKNQDIIKFHTTTMIPVSVSAPETPERQIALYAKADCQRLGVPDSNVFFEAGMRATLAIEMANVMSPQVNAVNFGGAATNRPVNADLFVWDEQTQIRRLKKCNEHYSKFVTELWYSVRECVEGRQVRELSKAVADEFGMREWEFVPGPLGQRIELETKDKCKARMGASPNKADAAAIALEGARRLGFVIARMPDPDAPKPDGDVWLEREIRQHRDMMKKRTLKYA